MADISETTVFIATGMFLLPRLIDATIGAFRWSAQRNVETADKAKEKAEKEFDELVEDVGRLDRDVVQLTAAHNAHKDSVNTALGSIDGRLVALDNRVAAQGKAYEERIAEGFKRLEIELNRKLAQMANDVEKRGRRGRS